ncbi:MAG TPA: alpha/beta fold hydrolase [Gammaproteobacteria bacterium]
MPIERRFEVAGLTLAAQEWGPPDGLPVLAVHGWLDNSGSFDRLAPLLEGCRVVAVDLAGQGRSDFRSPDASYLLWQDVADLLEIADQLGWSELVPLGHSRGAAVATLFAAAFPERVVKLVLLEGGVPLTSSAEEAPRDLARALRDRRALLGKQGRVFADRDTAIRERAEGFSPVSREAAEILARRSLREVPGGFTWHADQRLKARSEFRYTPDMAVALVAAVEAPVLMLLAERSPFADLPAFQSLAARFRKLESHRLPGGHHFHLEGAEHELARRIRAFLGLR